MGPRNTDRSIGIKLKDGKFDSFVRKQIAEMLEWEAAKLRANCQVVTKTLLASVLGMHRNRLVRICQALEITGLFD